jgi:hypothetical protein
MATQKETEWMVDMTVFKAHTLSLPPYCLVVLPQYISLAVTVNPCCPLILPCAASESYRLE